jgi:hypothetical protein
MFKSPNAFDCNRQAHMRASLLIIPFALAACASQAPLSEGEQRINELAKERSRGERFPVLRPLPSRREALGQGEKGNTRQELAIAAVPLKALTASMGEGPGEEPLEDVAAELRSLVAELRRGKAADPVVDIEALAFPTPPPLDPEG